jgi:hypothetical protein
LLTFHTDGISTKEGWKEKEGLRIAMSSIPKEDAEKGESEIYSPLSKWRKQR